MDYDETVPDTAASMSDQELKETIDRLTDEEREVSYRRRVLHGQIDILRAELVNRLKAKREGGETTLSGADVSSHRHPPGQGRAAGGAEDKLMAVHCPECGSSTRRAPTIVGSAGYLGRPEGADEPTTMTYKVDETGEYTPVDIEDEVDDAGAALVIRSGGGRAGRASRSRATGCRSAGRPTPSVFLDDVTVSRNHAFLVRREDGFYIDDLGSPERHLREPASGSSPTASDGDEIQIGKYKLSYLER